LLRTAVPEFDLPGEELQIDLDAILDLGVELICDQPLEHLSDLEALFDQGARAVVLATGAGKGRGLGIPGEQLAGSTDALGFAERQRINPEPIERPVVVAGGGSTAVAVARMAKKAGAPSVKLVFRRARQAIPARAASLRLAEDEGVELISECQVVHILGDRSVAGVRCAPIVFSAPDRVGRRWPVSEGEPFVLPAGWFIAAEDRLPDLAWTGQDERLRRSPLGTLQSGFDGLTGWPGVFAAGEVTLGARNVVAVMAHGIRVARAVADFVSRA
jgi:glutamate synthase (NADPH/NADH) small chain